MKNNIEEYFLPLDELEISQKKTGNFSEEFMEERETKKNIHLVIRDHLF